MEMFTESCMAFGYTETIHYTHFCITNESYFKSETIVIEKREVHQFI